MSQLYVFQLRLIFFYKKINQADISVLWKADIKDQLTKAQKAFNDENKAREKAANKAVSTFMSQTTG
jgi:hypothetical protein